MTVNEAKKVVEENGGDWEIFCSWMYGQTCGIDKNGNPDIYDYDVQRFVRYNCNPKNEPLHEWD